MNSSYEQSPPGFSQPDPQFVNYLQWLFSFNLLSIQQKVFTLSQKYYVYDEEENPRFYIVRPPKIFANLIVSLIGSAISIFFLVIGILLILKLNSFIFGIGFIMVTGYISSLFIVAIRPYRDIYIYTDDTESFPVLTIIQENKLDIYQYYGIYDALGNHVATAKRYVLWSYVRRKWMIESINGEPIVTAQEDSMVLSLLRRYLGPLWGALRTNFDIYLPGKIRVGEFNRKFTVTDQYTLDLREDPHQLVDRRVALSLAILLDSAEGR